MASALGPPRGPKPSHYHEGFLEKKGPRDLDFKKFWARLQGLSIYFYNSGRDLQHVEKLDLGAFVKLTDEAPWGRSRDAGIHFSLVLRNQEIKFKVDSLESREMWKGYILTVVELRVPSTLTLLPGHLYMLAEALAKEEARRAFQTPPCFLKVSRLEAQLLLERYPECGNLLLRPSGDGAGGVSVTTRQLLNGLPVVRHYKVKHEGPTYVIDVEKPFSCTSLDAVVNYFETHTNRALVPFLLDEDYEKELGYVEANEENGENVWVTPPAPGPGPVPPLGGPKQPLPVPTPTPTQDRPPPLPPLPPPPSPNEDYVIPIADDPAADYVNEDVPPPSRPVIPKPRKPAKVQAKAAKPPVVPRPEPRGLHAGLVRKLAAGSGQALFPSPGLAEVTAELEEKLQKRRALEH
ncbi:signal-transducing adaptor protein 2 [Dasypus novemcinctus]|uniref:signal-transducing adaptor protein 2 n=1 Tax=Dasypus novemcinctus TaxID=9361 RepID=UPI00265E3909|nr:signal-transducing adaptor protein 2 [Dasypus novemcinctus]XP_058138058.1 signal-transducing adaptor protein 2 [Dasypus novemcinctus]